MKIMIPNNFTKNNKKKESKIFDRSITNNETKKPFNIQFENLLNSESSNSILSMKNNIIKLNKRKISMFNNMNLYIICSFLLIIIIILSIFLYKCYLNKPRKIKVNELNENYDFVYSKKENDDTNENKIELNSKLLNN